MGLNRAQQALMSTHPDSAPPKPSAHDRRRIAAVACVHPRTVDRCYQAKPVRSTIAARVVAAAAELGLPKPSIVVAP